MARLTTQKTSFTAGEISPTLFGRGDLRAYQNGAAKLNNIFIHPTGGLSRRHGLRYVDTARGIGRLVPFEFNTEQVYLIVFTDLKADIYQNDTLVAAIDCPWTLSEVQELSWVQSADTLLIVHPNHSPRKILRNAQAAWEMVNWTFVEEDQRIQQPHHKFAADAHTLQASGTSGNVTLTASADVFDAAHAGTRLRLQNKELEVTSVSSPTEAMANVKETLASTSATKDWDEQTFSAVRGWPISCCFHQDRLVIG